MSQPISIRDSCIEVIKDLTQKTTHLPECALRQFKETEKGGYPLCDCGHFEMLDTAAEIIFTLRGDHP